MYIGPTSRRHSPVKMDSQKFTSPLIQRNQKQKRNAEEDIFSPIPQLLLFESSEISLKD